MIDILIPTYNRSKDLIENLSIISKQVEKSNLTNEVTVIISNNCSNDDTDAACKAFIELHPSIKVKYFKTDSNIGLEKNAVQILSKAESEYIMFLGDDDYLPDGYIEYSLNEIKQDKLLGCIIPGNIHVDNETGKNIVRNTTVSSKKFKPGFDAMSEIGHYSHQMSGIVLKRENLLESYLNQNLRNVYLFMYFSLLNMSKFNSVYASRYMVFINVENSKDWKYDNTGLLSEVYKSYFPFKEQLGDDKLCDLILDFTARQSWRFGIEVYKPIISFKRFVQLLKKSPDIKGLKKKLTSLYLKDYFYRLFPSLNPYNDRIAKI